MARRRRLGVLYAEDAAADGLALNQEGERADYLARLETGFRESGPLYAWLAIVFCHAAGQPMPEWVSSYFTDSARRLLALGYRNDSGELDAAKITKALKLTGERGQPNAFAKVRQHRQVYHRARTAERALERGGVKTKQAIGAAMDAHGVSERTVRRARATHRKKP